MSRILITGASGYIGRRVCEVAINRGLEVVVLGNAPLLESSIPRFDWRLGDNPPASAFAGVTAVIHLGHSWASDTAQGVSPTNLNVVGTEKLASATFATGVARLVFASTISSRPQALNAYGRIKNLIEQRLLGMPGAETRVAIARIGLVYGVREEGLYGLLSKLVRITPILPMIGLDRQVQPIYLDEVVDGLLTLASKPSPQRNNNSLPVFVLAGPKPCSFGGWLRMLRRAHTGKRLILLPVPMWMALLACDITRLLPFMPTVDRERVLGLAGTAPMESSTDLAALGIEVVCPSERLSSLRSQRRRFAAEAAAMLSYVSGQRNLSKGAVARLIWGIRRQSAQPLGFPRVVLKYPALLRIFDPLMSSARHRLGQRLHLAVMVMESAPNHNPQHRRVRSLLVQTLLEAVALPFRLVLGNFYA